TPTQTWWGGGMYGAAPQQAGGMGIVAPIVRQPTSPCPMPGYPAHTQWNGVTCCIPGACVPKPASSGSYQATWVTCVKKDKDSPTGEKFVGAANCRGNTDCCGAAYPGQGAFKSVFGD